MLAEKIFFPIVAFPPGNETKFSSTICDMKLGEMLPGGDLSEFMLSSLSTITCFGGNNC